MRKPKSPKSKPGSSVCFAGSVAWLEPDGSRIMADKPVACAMCGTAAIVMLPPSLIARQPDDTTHVCHPGLGGCNHGFSCLP